MAKIRIEQKTKSVWPWIIAAIVALLLLWALVAMLGRDERAAVPVGADQTAAPMTTSAPATAPAATAPDEALARYAGEFSSANMQLNVDADGTYTMQESPAGQGQGRWTHDASANALRLVPADGSQERYFRIEGSDTLIPLNPEGEPAAQMAPLQRRAAS